MLRSASTDSESAEAYIGIIESSPKPLAGCDRERLAVSHRQPSSHTVDRPASHSPRSRAILAAHTAGANYSED
jgi:hypothetical protein